CSAGLWSLRVAWFYWSSLHSIVLTHCLRAVITKALLSQYRAMGPLSPQLRSHFYGDGPAESSWPLTMTGRDGSRLPSSLMRLGPFPSMFSTTDPRPWLTAPTT